MKQHEFGRDLHEGSGHSNFHANVPCSATLAVHAGNWNGGKVSIEVKPLLESHAKVYHESKASNERSGTVRMYGEWESLEGSEVAANGEVLVDLPPGEARLKIQGASGVRATLEVSGQA